MSFWSKCGFQAQQNSLIKSNRGQIPRSVGTCVTRGDEPGFVLVGSSPVPIKFFTSLHDAVSPPGSLCPPLCRSLSLVCVHAHVSPGCTFTPIALLGSLPVILLGSFVHQPVRGVHRPGSEGLSFTQSTSRVLWGGGFRGQWSMTNVYLNMLYHNSKLKTRKTVI